MISSLSSFSIGYTRRALPRCFKLSKSDIDICFFATQAFKRQEHQSTCNCKQLCERIAKNIPIESCREEKERQAHQDEMNYQVMDTATDDLYIQRPYSHSAYVPESFRHSKIHSEPCSDEPFDGSDE